MSTRTVESLTYDIQAVEGQQSRNDERIARKGPRILDLGCGLNKIKGSVGMDCNLRSEADILHDLNDFPYPVVSNSFDIIYCQNVMEHLNDVTRVMEELHRIGKPGAIVKITVPFFRSRWAFSDPDHRRFFTSLSFDCFVRGKELAAYSYTDRWFDLERVDFRITMSYRRFSVIREALDRIFLRFANRRKMFYEAYFAHIIPVDEIYFELRVIKDTGTEYEKR